MDIHDIWNYPVSSFLRLLTPLYTERKNEKVIIPVFYFTGETVTVVRNTGEIKGTRETGELGEE